MSRDNVVVRDERARVTPVTQGKVQGTSTLYDWAGYINKMNRQDRT